MKANNNETTKRPDWAQLLQDAINEPGKIHSAYSTFHGYSLGNRIIAMFTCMARGIEIGPIASFNRWKELGRSVRKGEKAIALCMPVTINKQRTAADGTETADKFQLFMFRNNWFVLSQTDGAEYVPVSTPEWNETKALEALEVTKVGFDLTDGNIQGYAAVGRKLAVNPVAAMPYKTLFHELAHILLGHCDEHASLADSELTPKDIREVEAESVAMLCCASLQLPGVEYSRGYIQSWFQGSEIPAKSAQRIFAAADKILKAGSAE